MADAISTSPVPPGGVATLPVTAPDLLDGLAVLAVCAASAPPDGTAIGAFLMASPDFAGAFALDAVRDRPWSRSPRTERAVTGDAASLARVGAGPLAEVCGLSALQLSVSRGAVGTVALWLVQTPEVPSDG